jgi:2-keto-myo-inositol isomerase
MISQDVNDMQFTLNHMVAPNLGYEAFFDLARSLGIDSVEIRNDIATSQMDMPSARRIRGWAEARGLTIISVNALQRFNQWNDSRAEEAKTLADYAQATGARALVLCPVNDTGFTPANAQRLDGLRNALAGLAPILKDHGLTGLVEPLGFAECSLRHKSEAIAAIDATGTDGNFKLVHDSFHHFVAGEKEMFPSRTGLVHISGVTDKSQTTTTMRDPHRVLVNGDDMIDNVGQIRKLSAGYKGAFSFEPFAITVHEDANISRSLAASREYLSG